MEMRHFLCWLLTVNFQVSAVVCWQSSAPSFKISHSRQRPEVGYSDFNTTEVRLHLRAWAMKWETLGVVAPRDKGQIKARKLRGLWLQNMSLDWFCPSVGEKSSNWGGGRPIYTLEGVLEKRNSCFDIYNILEGSHLISLADRAPRSLVYMAHIILTSILWSRIQAGRWCGDFNSLFMDYLARDSAV